MAPGFIVPVGIIFVGLGLCLWLGGLTWHRGAGAFLAALIAAVSVLFLQELTLHIALVAIIFAAAIGMVLDKPAIIFSGGIAAAIVLLTILSPAIEFDSDTPSAGAENLQTQTAMTASQSATLGIEWIKYYATNIHAAIGQSEPIIKAISVGLALAVIFVGIALRRPVSAVACATVGTAVVFFGMVTLLLYKGSQPLTHICQKSGFYTTVAVCMVIFGTAAELLLCPAKPGLDQKGEQKNKSK